MRKPLFRILLIIAIALLLSVGAIFAWALAGLPSPDTLTEHLNTPSMRILDRNGQLLYEAISQEGGRHSVVPIERIPLALQQATIATEDANFYTHPGFDLTGIVRAALKNLGGGETIAGGSTITQQVARNLLLEDERSERTVRRKLREVFLAWQLTRLYEKDEILAFYLNQNYYGGMAYGVEAAAQTYFGKSVAELDLAECALIAGLPQAPGLYNPFTDLEAANARQSVVLGLMQDRGYITHEQHSLAEREPLVLASEPYPMEAPHFVQFVLAQVDRLLSQEEIYALGGIQVRTTLNLDWQRHAERAIDKQLDKLQHSPDGLGHNVHNAALVALDPQTGDILTMVGSPDFSAAEGGAVNMALSPRQPGSALKPLLYASSLDPKRANPWTAATMLLDVRTSFLTRDGKAYTPENYDRSEHGPVLLRDALASSLNIPAVKTLDHIGLEDLFDFATKLGVTTLGDPQEYDLSLALGGGAVRLLDLTAAYGALANGGYRVAPRAILEITGSEGAVIYTPSAVESQRVVDPHVAWLISDILSDDEARILGFGANSVLKLDRPAAVKTGTTSNFHDNWTVGYTPQLVVGVWAGNANYEPMREVTGLTGAAPIWHSFIRTVLNGQPVLAFSRPGDMLSVEVCKLSGRLPTKACPYRRAEWFIPGTEPSEEDSFYRIVQIDQDSGELASPATPPDRTITQTVLDLPPEAQPWARRQGLLLYTDLLAHPAVEDQSVLRLVSPPQQSEYWIANTWHLDAQKLRIEAVAGAGLRQVTLYLDGSPLAVLDQAPYAVFWQLAPGEHRVWAEATLEDGSGQTSEVVTFRVLTGP